MIQTAIHEVAGEEALAAVDLEPRHVHVAAGVGVQCFFRRADGVEQRQPRLARHDLVVPLEDESTPEPVFKDNGSLGTLGGA